MKVCGFSFVRNGTKFDYPFEEAIKSILPVCDQVIVAVGNSEDDTLQRVRAIDPKVKVIETVWDESKREGGQVLAEETNKAFQSIAAEFDWAFYIQGDEVLHERDIPVVKAAMEKYLHTSKVEGLLVKYVHFFGSYEYVGMKHSWYRREIRIVRNQKDIFSYKDAQGFRRKPNEKLKVKLIDAHIHHYGWVRQPDALQNKEKTKIRLYKDDQWIDQHFSKSDTYEYESMREPLTKFTGTHPQVMLARIKKQDWPFTPDMSLKYSSFKDWLKRTLGKWTGWYPGEYKNYKRI
jgi:glycosyltransferase involved in cell wall biosynthesis